LHSFYIIYVSETTNWQILGQLKAHIGDMVTYRMDVLETPIYNEKLKCIRWKKFVNGSAVPIDIHSEKYRGSLSEFAEQCLVINNVKMEDGASYLLEIIYEDKTEQSIINLEVIEGMITIQVFTL
jgi:hypothetical protein